MFLWAGQAHTAKDALDILIEFKLGMINYTNKKQLQVYWVCLGGTQIWVGYRGAAQSFDHHPIAKPEKMQNCNLYLVFQRALLLTN